ncbi:MAG: ribose 5-phosphate isomerase B [Planctomycetes bacterium]|nr:ribose 5-phosphate isomerase B [Planctomycetota bacterium]
MKIAIGADHRGVKYKNMVKKILQQQGHHVNDFGTDSEVSTDYPDHAYPVACAVAEGEVDRGVLICASGIGMSIAANRFKGVRGTLCLSEKMAETARTHNNSNLLCLAQDLIDERTVRKIVDTWLTTDFEGGRHERRLNKVDELCGEVIQKD